MKPSKNSIFTYELQITYHFYKYIWYTNSVNLVLNSLIIHSISFSYENSSLKVFNSSKDIFELESLKYSWIQPLSMDSNYILNIQAWIMFVMDDIWKRKFTKFIFHY